VSELVNRAREAGIVGAGGAGFPSAVKYDTQVDTVLANGAECEPLLYVDQSIMTREAARVVRGLELVVEATGAGRGIICLKEKYHTAIKALREAIIGKPHLEINLLGNFYPSGDEQVLVYETLGRIVPEGGIPLEVGAVVTNVVTLFNLARAYDQGLPVIERPLTVHGAVAEPCTFMVPLGTSLAEVLKVAGGATVPDYGLIVGGPMMGRVADSRDEPVTKTTSGILVLPVDHPFYQRKIQTMRSVVRIGRSACDQCRLCTDLCPRYHLGHAIQPHMIMRSLPYGISDSRIISIVFTCCECQVCSFFACPLHLSPGTICGRLKKEMIAKGARNPHRRSDLAVHPDRVGRRLPTARLVERLGLLEYQGEAPWKDVELHPARVCIPLSQHLGAPAVAVVKVGQGVKKGDLLGEIPPGKLGARVHASIDGVVSAIEDGTVIIEAQ